MKDDELLRTFLFAQSWKMRGETMRIYAKCAKKYRASPKVARNTNAHSQFFLTL